MRSGRPLARVAGHHAGGLGLEAEGRHLVLAAGLLGAGRAVPVRHRPCRELRPHRARRLHAARPARVWAWHRLSVLARMSDRLEVAVAVLPEAWPVLEALRALSIDV